MELNEFQKKAMSTCLPSSNNFSYMFLNLVGEIGEFASKVAKAIRKTLFKVKDNNLEWNFPNPFSDDHEHMTTEDYDGKQMLELKKEAGDIMWQIAGLCSVMGWSLEEICQMNLDKLQARKAAGTIDGSGDGITDRTK